mgnify:CR=1 FL=1
MPQSLCLDMHQSGLSLSMIFILSLPHSGINLISSNALVAPSNKPDLVIDGLFGIGINRVLDESWINFISEINAQKFRVLSVDIPSGIDATTGEIQGAAIRANETLTLGLPKTGLLKPKAIDYVGRIHVAREIGLVQPIETSDIQLNETDDFSEFPPGGSLFTKKNIAFANVLL